MAIMTEAEALDRAEEIMEPCYVSATSSDTQKTAALVTVLIAGVLLASDRAARVDELRRMLKWKPIAESHGMNHADTEAYLDRRIAEIESEAHDHTAKSA